MPDLRRCWIVFVLVFVVGCDDEEKKLRIWQQEQVTQLQQQSQENSAAARALVEADAESRRQFLALEQSVHEERREVAAARERVPLLATAFQGLAALALGISALWVCNRLLGRLNADDDAAELEETLILSVAGESDLFHESRLLIKPPPDVPALSGVDAEAEEETAVIG
jgi:hypothetical protein